MEGPTFGLNTKTHANQAVFGVGLFGGIKANTIVANRNFHVVFMLAQVHPDMTSLSIFGDVGDGFLNQPVDHQFRIDIQINRLQRTLNIDARVIGKLSCQNLQRRNQPQVAQRRWTQIFDDASTQRNPAIEGSNQM